MIESLAPIVLFVYNRPQHTLQTLQALQKNELADKSHLYIFCDGPKKDSDDKNSKKIEEVRAVIRQKKWCKEVVIKEQACNMGLANSVINAVSEITNEYGKAIVLEDDIITGKFFLKFMNEALEIYKNDSRVYGISGFCYFDDLKIASTYLLPIGSSWGWATWKNKWSCFEKNPFILIEEIDRRGIKNKFNFGNYPFYSMLKDNCEKKNDSWAIRFYASFFLKSGFFLFPNKSFVRNIGFDSSGTHCGNESDYDPLLYNGEIEVNYLGILSNSEIQEKVEKRFNKRFASEGKNNAIQKILIRLKNKIKKTSIAKLGFK